MNGQAFGFDLKEHPFHGFDDKSGLNLFKFQYGGGSGKEEEKKARKKAE